MTPFLAPFLAAQFQCNQANRLVLTTDPNGHHTGYSYTATGQLASSTDGNGYTTQYQYDPAGQLVGIVAPNNPPSGALTAFQYNAAGALSAETDPAGNTTRYGYDLSGNLASVTDAFSNSSQTTFDNNNQPLETVDRDGRTKAFTYDKDGRLTNEAWYNAQGVQVDNRAYTYDQAGNLLSASNNYGSYVFTYDNAGKLLTQTGPFNLGLTYQYDGAGNVTQVADSRGGQVTSSYDENNQLVSRTLSGTGLIPLRFDLGYTPDGQVQSLTRYRDLAGTQKVSTSAFTYDDAGNLTDVQHTSASGAILSDYSYTYDRADQLASETDNGTQTDYSYDPAGQLLSATVGRTSTAYSYDANGNRTLSGYVTGKDNELLSDGTWNYTYDAEGNVISKTNIATGAIWTYGYDLDNHLTSAVEKDSSGNLIQEVTLYYDVFGDLIEQDTYTASSGQWVVQRFARDAEGNVWADLDGNNNLVARRVYADINGQTQAIARETISGGSASAAAWYLTDHLGSVRDIQDNATGSIIDHLDYDAYGNVANQTQPSNGDRIEYAQGEWQAALGLYHFGERWYDPTSGRWQEQDPLGLGPDSNEHRYVGNGPTDWTDPSGLDRGLWFLHPIDTIRDIFRHHEYDEDQLKHPIYSAPPAELTQIDATSPLNEPMAIGSRSMHDAGDMAANTVRKGPGVVGRSMLMVGSMFLPGPEDLVMAKVLGTLAKKGFRVVVSGGKRVLMRVRAGRLRKLTTGEIRRVNAMYEAEKTAAATGKVLVVGQTHHPISAPIARALGEHPTLKGLAKRRMEFTTVANGQMAHKGYDKFHRDLDAEVIGWIRDPAHRGATEEQFLAWLRNRYQQPDLKARFPNEF